MSPHPPRSGGLIFEAASFSKKWRPFFCAAWKTLPGLTLFGISARGGSWEFDMKKLATALPLIALLTAPSLLQARPRLADFSSLTCDEFMQMGQNNTIPILFWIEGWLSAKDGINNMNEPHMEKTMQSFMRYCAANRSAALDAALKSLERGRGD